MTNEILGQLRSGLSLLLTYTPLLAAYLPVIVTSAVTVVCLMLCLGMRVQMRKIKAQVSVLEQKTVEAIDDPKVALVEGDDKAKTPGEPLIITNLTKVGLDTTVRSKVLKMHRQGQSAEQIAGTLHLSRGEVDLLVKIHEIELGALGSPASA
jgi:hypothetical protein